MGARAAFMLAVGSVPSLFAPAALETLIGKCDQRFRRVVPVSALRPGDDQRSRCQREGLVERKTRTLVFRADPAIGIEEHATGLIRPFGVRPILWRRRGKMPAVFPKVEAGLCLDEELDVD